MSLDWNALTQRVLQEMAVGITAGAGIVSARAKQLAPVRKAFAGGRRKFRFLTKEEYAESMSARAALGLGGLNIAPVHVQKNSSASSKRRLYATVVTRGDSRNMNVTISRMVANPEKAYGEKGHLIFSAAEATVFGPKGGQSGGLTRRGRYELNSLRSLSGGMLGGRLRDEISVIPAEPGEKTTARVVSPTPYAKYQEYGTRHNPAHPFMRPAAAEASKDVVAAVRGLVGSAVKSGVGRQRIRVRLSVKP